MLGATQETQVTQILLLLELALDAPGLCQQQHDETRRHTLSQ